MTKIKQTLKTIKKKFKKAWRDGLVTKVIVIISALALLATTVLPYVI